MNKFVYGIDVNAFQTSLDWTKAWDAGARFVWAKMTGGADYLSPAFLNHWTGSGEVGMLRGAFHWFNPLVEAKYQAAWIEKNYPDDAELPLAIDIEDGRIRKSHVANLAWLMSWADERYEKPCIAYTSLNCWEKFFGEFQHWVRKHPLWVANYRKLAGPMIPAPYAPVEWLFWQYSDKGDAPYYGVSQTPKTCKQLDLDIFNGSLEDLYDFIGKPM